MAYTLQIDFRSYLLYHPALLYNIYAMKKKEKTKKNKKKNICHRSGSNLQAKHYVMAFKRAPLSITPRWIVLIQTQLLYLTLTPDTRAAAGSPNFTCLRKKPKFENFNS